MSDGGAKPPRASTATKSMRIFGQSDSTKVEHPSSTRSSVLGFRIPTDPSPPVTAASSYMAPRNMEEYGRMIRFSRKVGYLYRLTSTHRDLSRRRKSKSDSESLSRPGSGSVNVNSSGNDLDSATPGNCNRAPAEVNTTGSLASTSPAPHPSAKGAGAEVVHSAVAKEFSSGSGLDAPEGRGSDSGKPLSKTRRKKRARRWSKRYFVLNSGYLYTFRSQEEALIFDSELDGSRTVHFENRLSRDSSLSSSSLSSSSLAAMEHEEDSAKQQTSTTGQGDNSDQPRKGSGKHHPLQLSRMLKVGTTSKFRDDRCFMVQMDDGSKLVLRADDRKERDAWLFAFHKSIAKIVSMLLSDQYGRGAINMKDGVRRGSLQSDEGMRSNLGLSLDMMNISSMGTTAAGDAAGFGKNERSLSDDYISPTSSSRKADQTFREGSTSASFALGTATQSRQSQTIGGATSGTDVRNSLPRSIVRKVTRLNSTASEASSVLSPASHGSSGSSGIAAMELGESPSDGQGAVPPPLAGVCSPVRTTQNRRTHKSQTIHEHNREGHDLQHATEMGFSAQSYPIPPYSPRSNVSDRSSMSDFMFDCDLDASADSPIAQRSLQEEIKSEVNIVSSVQNMGIFASAVSSSIGRRDKMEDVHVVVDDMVREYEGTGAARSVAVMLPKTSYYAVFDGHAGKKAAEFCRDHLQSRLARDDRFWDSDPETVSHVLVEAFKSVDEDFLRECDASNGTIYAGSTATVCIVREAQVWVATLGDSAAMLGKHSSASKAAFLGLDLTSNAMLTSSIAGGMDDSATRSHVMLSDPQTPGRADEVERIEKAGGWVTKEKEMFLGRLQDMDLTDPFIRNYAETKVGMVNIYRVNGDISVSRAIGDPDYKIGHGLDKETSAIPYPWNWRNAPENHPRTFSDNLIIAV